MEKIITFEKSAKEEVLGFFGKAVDEDGYIIDKVTHEKVPASDGDDLEFEQFAGIRKGSLVFIKSDINSIIELLDSIKRQDRWAS